MFASIGTQGDVMERLIMSVLHAVVQGMANAAGAVVTILACGVTGMNTDRAIIGGLFAYIIILGLITGWREARRGR